MENVLRNVLCATMKIWLVMLLLVFLQSSAAFAIRPATEADLVGARGLYAGGMACQEGTQCSQSTPDALYPYSGCGVVGSNGFCVVGDPYAPYPQPNYNVNCTLPDPGGLCRTLNVYCVTWKRGNCNNENSQVWHCEDPKSGSAEIQHNGPRVFCQQLR